jgi:fibronectin type 3 domain-containing protein
MSIEAIFAQLEAGLKADPSVVKRVNGIYQFNIDVSGQKVSYVVDLKNGDGKITKGTGTADCTYTRH